MKNCPTCQKTYPDDFSLCPRDGAALVESGAWIEGAVVRGKYRILSKLGQGGMGAVYKAVHLAFDETRALKVMSPQVAGDPLFVKRFKQEAIITRKLQHPNAVRVDDIDESDDGRPFIVMEFIEGKSLKHVIESEGPMPVPRVCAIIKQVAAALGAAHELGMVHRDIKPDNIVLVARIVPRNVAPSFSSAPSSEIAKVLDFGIAKLKEVRAEETAGMSLTGTGVVIGTPQYMSPEQAAGKRGDELDGRSDLYSLGVVMYEMLSGSLPFKSDTPMGMLVAHMHHPPNPILSVRPGLQIPDGVAAIVMKCLEKKPEHRPASAAALIAELDRAENQPAVPLAPTRVPTPPPRPDEAGSGSAPPPATSGFPKAKSSPALKKSRVALWVTAPVFVVVLGLGYLWMINRDSTATKTPAENPSTTKPQGKPVAPKISAGPEKLKPKDGLKYVWIPPGTFQMGCSPGDTECGDEEKPAHQVTITKGFWVGQTPVTVGAYKRFSRETSHAMPPAPSFNNGWSNEQMPVISVNWDDAKAYCGWAGGRLPTEAEWEYAARGGNTEARYGDIDSIAWYSANSGGRTHNVGEKRANGFGLFDMLGNGMEWVNDWYDENYYRSSPSQDPLGPSRGTVRVLRGGSWAVNGARDVRVSTRSRYYPGGRYSYFGFRCVGEVFAP